MEHPKFKTSSRDVTTLLSWTVCHPSAGTSYVRSTRTPNMKSMFTHYEDMKRDEKCKDRGYFGG